MSEDPAKYKTKSFAGDTREYGDERLPKITQAGITILAMVDNKFVSGFKEHETAKLQAGNVLPFLPDITQWVESCRANPKQLSQWMSEPEGFTQHCNELLCRNEMDITKAGKLFSDVFDSYTEILGAQVEVKEPKKEKGTTGAKPKKKASSRPVKRNTVSP